MLVHDGSAPPRRAEASAATPSSACAELFLCGNPGSDASFSDDYEYLQDSKVKEALASPERAAALALRQAE